MLHIQLIASRSFGRQASTGDFLRAVLIIFRVLQATSGLPFSHSVAKFDDFGYLGMSIPLPLSAANTAHLRCLLTIFLPQPHKYEIKPKAKQNNSDSFRRDFGYLGDAFCDHSGAKNDDFGNLGMPVALPLSAANFASLRCLRTVFLPRPL